jgi:hypothetical protein
MGTPLDSAAMTLRMNSVTSTKRSSRKPLVTLRRYDPAGDWKKYIPYIPSHAKAMGTITLDGDTGALVKMKAGSYYLVQGPFKSRKIPAWRIRAIVGGSPTKVADGKRVCVYLDADTIDKAYAIGRHNVSEGIRKAVAKFTGFE